MESKTNSGKNLKTSSLDSIPRDAKLDFLTDLIRVREESVESAARLEAAIEKVGKVATPDCLAPAAMAGFNIPSAARGIPTTLYMKAQNRFSLIVRTVRRESSIASSTP